MNDETNPELENIEFDPHLLYTFLSAQRGDPEAWETLINNMTNNLKFSREKVETILDTLYQVMAETTNSN